MSHQLLQVHLNPAGLHSHKQSTTEHFTKDRMRGFAQRLDNGPARVARHGSRVPAPTALVQRLSSLPSGECFIVLYLKNTGKAFAFPHQVVRIPFDEMRRYQVTNLPRGCRWGASKVPSLRVAQVSKNKRPPISQQGPRLPSKAAPAGGQAAPGWGGGA